MEKRSTIEAFGPVTGVFFIPPDLPVGNLSAYSPWRYGWVQLRMMV